MSERAHVREVGLRDGLQSIAEVMPTEQKIAWLDAEYARRGARDRGQLVCPAEAAAAARRCRGGRASCADPARPHRLGADPQPQGRRARPGARRARDELRAVGQRGAQPLECPPQHRGVGRGFPPRRGAVPDRGGRPAPAHRLRPRHRLRLHDRGRGRRGPGAPHRGRGRRGRRRRDRSSPTPSATVSRRRSSASSAGSWPMSRRCRCPAHFHDTRGLGLANVLAALNAGARAFDASLGGLGGCPYAPGATGNIVTEDLAFMLEAMGFETGIDLDRLIAVRELVHHALPNVVQHGAIAKAGLPKNFHASQWTPSWRRRPNEVVDDAVPLVSARDPASESTGRSQ